MSAPPEGLCRGGGDTGFNVRSDAVDPSVERFLMRPGEHEPVPD